MSIEFFQQYWSKFEHFWSSHWCKAISSDVFSNVMFFNRARFSLFFNNFAVVVFVDFLMTTATDTSIDEKKNWSFLTRLNLYNISTLKHFLSVSKWCFSNFSIWRHFFTFNQTCFFFDKFSENQRFHTNQMINKKFDFCMLERFEFYNNETKHQTKHVIIVRWIDFVKNRIFQHRFFIIQQFFIENIKNRWRWRKRANFFQFVKWFWFFKWKFRRKWNSESKRIFFVFIKIIHELNFMHDQFS